MDIKNKIEEILKELNINYEVLYSDGTSSYDIDFYNGNEYYSFYPAYPKEKYDNTEITHFKYFPIDNEIGIYHSGKDSYTAIQIEHLKKYLT